MMPNPSRFAVLFGRETAHTILIVKTKLELIEQMLRQMRDLVKFINPQEQYIVYTNFEDELGEIVEAMYPQSKLVSYLTSTAKR
ncbi:hypothetical protein [Nostoc sp. CCY 9925]|uniref:hypothetical protein n=1 Tax=Nostoc sp. CCY 9925 TaxID=3103865 RepID=UPI0039C5F428